MPPGGRGYCARCRAPLYSNRPYSVERTLAFIATAAVLLMIANAFPIMALEMQGQRHATTLIGAVRALWDQDVRSLAVLVCATTIVFPIIEVAAMLYMLAPLRGGRVAPGVPTLLRIVQRIRPWGMVEVFLLGVLVSLVKLAHVASIHPGPALWAFGALMMMLAAAAMSFDVRSVWNRVELAR